MATSPAADSTRPVLPPPATLFDQLGQVYLLVDREGIMVEINDAFLALTGYAREQVIGQSFHQLFAPPAERELERRGARRRTVQTTRRPWITRITMTMSAMTSRT